MLSLHSLVTARAIILNDQGQLLIIRRSTTDPLHAGAWDIPGGQQEPGEDMTATVIRETQEEVGIRLSSPRLVYATSDIRNGVSKTWLFFADLLAPETKVRLGDEHDMYRWIDPDDIHMYTDYDILLRMQRYLVNNKVLS